MSKKDKLRARLDSIPKDFTWEELVSLMNLNGFRMLNGKGSRRKFFNETFNRVVSCHEPHPSSIVKKYVLEEVKALLDELENYE
ncbi:type II toxin-antitoxin system HicA family toxin [Erwinia sp. JUb26]|uniref:type II toxin-antitoxin system HicA family toxin n=1 Tax=Erwinia sp. JUb26 TaxID=2485126 RepID=UPI000F4A6577|nr:type II toxin-antitoxin system HicA family toxin [Erwinia sp. JUb26]ROR14958.1 HicA-like toxin of HicAB toxin-antitoxin system [Erwinia sp. JUb26]